MIIIIIEKDYVVLGLELISIYLHDVELNTKFILVYKISLDILK